MYSIYNSLKDCSDFHLKIHPEVPIWRFPEISLRFAQGNAQKVSPKIYPKVCFTSFAKDFSGNVSPPMIPIKFIQRLVREFPQSYLQTLLQGFPEENLARIVDSSRSFSKESSINLYISTKVRPGIPLKNPLEFRSGITADSVVSRVFSRFRSPRNLYKVFSINLSEVSTKSSFKKFSDVLPKSLRDKFLLKHLRESLKL